MHDNGCSMLLLKELLSRLQRICAKEYNLGQATRSDKFN